MSIKREIIKNVKKIVKTSNDNRVQNTIEKIKSPDPLDYGIVFCGGGARGAFQLGVWKKLEELGIAESFTGISGASVGALNALLFAQGDYQKANDAWMEMKKGDLKKPSKVLINKSLMLFGGGIPPAMRAIYILNNWSENFGLFSREKLKRIVKKNISSESLKNKQVYVSLSALTLKLDKVGKKEFFLKLKYTYLDPLDSIEKNIKKVLASAAYPGAYSPLTVDGKICIDGGAMDNEPVCPLIKAGYRNILVVHLKERWKDGKDREETFNKNLRNKISEEELEGIAIRHVWSQCSLKGILEIDPDLTQMRINAGYEATSDLTKYLFQ